MLLYTPEEINNAIKLVTELVLFIFATSVGTFTRELIFPKKNTFKENLGFGMLAAFIAFGVMLKFPGLTLELLFLICVGIGFFIPAFESWFKGKKIFKIILKIINKTSNITNTTLEEIEKELGEEVDGK